MADIGELAGADDSMVIAAITGYAQLEAAQCVQLAYEVMDMASTERLHFRVRADTQARLRSAAEMEHQSLTEFVLSAAEERAESVLSRQTVLPADFFDAMFNALSEPSLPNKAMRRVARSPRVSRHG